MAELCICKPVLWKLAAAIGHVFAAENSQFQHLPGRYLGQERWIEAHAARLGKVVGVILLHEIIYDNLAFLHHISANLHSLIIVSDAFALSLSIDDFD